MSYSWEPKYCVYDVCTCKHVFMEHTKVGNCYNSCYFDSKKQEVVNTEKCTCKKFKFAHSEDMSSYQNKGETR